MIVNILSNPIQKRERVKYDESKVIEYEILVELDDGNQVTYWVEENDIMNLVNDVREYQHSKRTDNK